MYDEFEKYCRSDNDLWKRLEEQGQNRQQNSSKNSEKSYTNQNASNQKLGQGQVLSIEGQPQPGKGNWKRHHGRRPRLGTKVGKVTKAKTRTKTTARNNAGHIAFFTAKT